MADAGGASSRGGGAGDGRQPAHKRKVSGARGTVPAHQPKKPRQQPPAAGGPSAAAPSAAPAQQQQQQQPRQPSVLALEVDASRYAAARASEIRALLATTRRRVTGLRAHQWLPRHMRRRATSHDPKRLPVRLRAQALREMERSNGTTATTKSRRKRRRASVAALHFAIRQKRCRWLETHLWHAKRFHVQDCWGLRMPISPSNSSVRCNFRWMRRQCIVRDMSFDVGFEMAGTTAALAMLLANITGNADKADTGDSKVPPANPMAAWLDGRQHEILLRDSNGATLAPAALLRRAGTGDNSQVWMWVHPAVGTAVEVLLTHAAETAACTVARITPSLVRFRLRGPGSTSVLARALRLAVEGQSGVTPGEGTPTNVADLWQFLSGTLSSPDQLTAGVVLGAVAWDPRLKPTRGATKEHTAFAPAAPQSRVQQKKLVELQVKWPAFCAETATIWSQEVRQTASRAMSANTTGSINARRQALLVPGDPLPPLRTDAKIPLLIAQHPGAAGATGDRSPRGLGAGWDLVLPANAGKPFWLALIYAGAHAYGLKQEGNIHVEMGKRMFPNDYIGTAAYDAWLAERAQTRFHKHLRRPPAKRNNFSRLGVPCPFGPDWAGLAASVAQAEGGAVASHSHMISQAAPMVRRKKAKGNMGEQSGATATAAAAEPAAVSATDSTTTRREAAPAKKQPQPLRMLVLRPSVGLPLAQTALELRAYKQRLLDGDATLADDSTLVLVRVYSAQQGVLTASSSLSVPSEADVAAFASGADAPVFPPKDTSWFRPLAGFVTSGDYSLARGATAGRAAVLACSLRAAAARVRAVLAAQSKLQATGLEVPILLLSRLPDSRQYRFAVCSLANNWA